MRNYRPFATLVAFWADDHGYTPGLLRARLLDRPPGIRERDRRRLGVQVRRGPEALSGRLLAVLGRARGAARVRGFGARERRAGASDRPDREQAQDSALDDLDRPESRLRGVLARLLR